MQSRAEAIGVVLALLCAALPNIETALQEASGNVGRREASSAIGGSTQAFVFDKGLPEAVAKELAWVSFACLRNTNSSSLLVVHNGGVALARGALGTAITPTGGGKPDLASVDAAVRKDLQGYAGFQALPEGGIVLRSRRDMLNGGVATWQSVPDGCCTAMVLPIKGGGGFVALSEYENAFPAKDVQWLQALAAKLGGVLAPVRSR